LSERLYTWFDRFNERFFEQKLQTPAISFRTTGIKRLGHYVIGRNDFGLKRNININQLYVNLPLKEILGILLHEMVHQWQVEFRKRKGRGNYHNIEFMKKTEELGIPSSKRGVTLGYGDPFVALLREQGVNAEITIGRDAPLLIPIPGKSKLKKWSCGCTNVRVAIEDFWAICLKCENEFKLCR
jgi:hypothetical protein